MIFAIQDEISLAIAENLKIKLLSGTKDKIASRHSDNLEAYYLYLKGLNLISVADSGRINAGITVFRTSPSKIWLCLCSCFYWTGICKLVKFNVGKYSP